jgi:hypothetical protein
MSRVEKASNMSSFSKTDKILSFLVASVVEKVVRAHFACTSEREVSLKDDRSVGWTEVGQLDLKFAKSSSNGSTLGYDEVPLAWYN